MTATADRKVDNEVFLRGRLAAEPTPRELPSGDELHSFRVTVARPPGDKPRVDSIDCAALSARSRRGLARAQPGDEVEIVGRLRRRFWRGPAGLGSRYEVLVDTVRVNRRPRSDA
jgi:single-strand DNA-binding protein